MTSQSGDKGGDWVPAGMNYAAYRGGGFKFAIRYVVPSIPGKMVTRDEIDAAHAAGVNVGFVYETTGTTWQGGRSAGMDDGRAANNAMLSLGVPHGLTCYHAIDSQVADSQLSTVTDWIIGLHDAMTDYHIGIYGQFSVMDWILSHEVDVMLWQTTAWSDGNVSPYIELFQSGQSMQSGITFDLDTQHQADAGFWDAPSVTPPPPPPPPPPHIHTAQGGWKFCHKCKCLFYGPAVMSSACAAGGRHDDAGSYEYTINALT